MKITSKTHLRCWPSMKWRRIYHTCVSGTPSQRIIWVRTDVNMRNYADISLQIVHKCPSSMPPQQRWLEGPFGVFTHNKGHKSGWKVFWLKHGFQILAYKTTLKIFCVHIHKTQSQNHTFLCDNFLHRIPSTSHISLEVRGVNGNKSWKAWP